MNDAKPSKSARKRDHLALQALGEKLIPLDLDELGKLALDQSLLDAVVHAKNIRSRGALRRQRQLIGKLMRDADADAIQASLERLGTQDRQARRTFRDAELWRDRIANEGLAAVTGFAEHTGGCGSVCHTRLEKLWRELRAAGNEPARRRVRRRIFREVHQRLSASKEPGEP